MSVCLPELRRANNRPGVAPFEVLAKSRVQCIENPIYMSAHEGYVALRRWLRCDALCALSKQSSAKPLNGG
jgi:hypothetical protein